MHDRTIQGRKRPAHAAGLTHRWPLLAAALLALPAYAHIDGPMRTETVAEKRLPLPEAVRHLPAIARPAGAPALGDARLEEMRGGTETPWSDMQLSGTVGGNTAINVVTGSNHITDGAFSNASGLPMVIQNSGSNVLIQNATIVNVRIQ